MPTDDIPNDPLPDDTLPDSPRSAEFADDDTSGDLADLTARLDENLDESLDAEPGVDDLDVADATTGAEAGAVATRTRVAQHAERGSSVGATIIGVVGELLITAGVFVAMFLVWQLWWTDVEGNAEQAKIVQNLGWAVHAPDPSSGNAGVKILTPAAGDPPEMSQPAAEGDTFAVMYIPAFGADFARPISEGTSLPRVLNVKGIGHYENTAMPGGIGNFAVAGHRTTYGKPFNLIADLQVGDAIVVQTQDNWFVYTVTETLIVDPHQVEVIAPQPGQPGVEPTGRYITLTACHPMFSAAQRYIVHGELAYWAPVDGDAVPAELAGG